MSMYITASGQALEANAKLYGKSVTLTHFVVGDGSIPASIADIEKMTALRHQVDQVQINRLAIDDTNKNWLIVEGIIPPENGPYEVAEVGILAEDGTLYAVGAYPRTVKPAADSSTWGKELYIKATLATSNAGLVQVKVDNTLVAATRAFVIDRIDEHEKSRNHPYADTSNQGMVKLSALPTAKAGTDGKTALTPAGGMAQLDDHRQEETAHEAGKIALSEALAAFVGAENVQAVLGMLGAAALRGVGSSDDDLIPMSAFKGVNQSLTENGYQILPGGMVVQCMGPKGRSQNERFNWPIRFPSRVWIGIAVHFSAGATGAEYISIKYDGLSGGTLLYGNSTGITTAILGVGY